MCPGDPDRAVQCLVRLIISRVVTNLGKHAGLTTGGRGPGLQLESEIQSRSLVPFRCLGNCRGIHVRRFQRNNTASSDLRLPTRKGRSG